MTRKQPTDKIKIIEIKPKHSRKKIKRKSKEKIKRTKIKYKKNNGKIVV